MLVVEWVPTLNIEERGDAELLGGLEGDREVLDHFVLAALAEVQCAWLKVRDQGTERKPVAPARVEVCHMDCSPHINQHSKTASAEQLGCAACCWRDEKEEANRL